MIWMHCFLNILDEFLKNYAFSFLNAWYNSLLNQLGLKFSYAKVFFCFCFCFFFYYKSIFRIRIVLYLLLISSFMRFGIYCLSKDVFITSK